MDDSGELGRYLLYVLLLVIPMLKRLLDRRKKRNPAPEKEVPPGPLGQEHPTWQDQAGEIIEAGLARSQTAGSERSIPDRSVEGELRAHPGEPAGTSGRLGRPNDPETGDRPARRRPLPAPLQGLGRDLRSPDRVAKALVWREILAAPVALRRTSRAGEGKR